MNPRPSLINQLKKFQEILRKQGYTIQRNIVLSLQDGVLDNSENVTEKKLTKEMSEKIPDV